MSRKRRRRMPAGCLKFSIMDTYTYRIGNKIYVNLTNRCSNDCEFCVRRTDSFRDIGLWLGHEPSAEEIINSLEDPDSAEEVVFCGYGEPMYRLDVMLEVADYLKSKGKKTRVNTNGQAELIVGAGVPEKLKGRLDTVNVSLNATSAKAYQELCHSEFGEKAFYAMLDFAKACKEYVPRVVLSVVDVIGEEEIKEAGKIAEALGVELRVRHYVR